MWMEKRRRKKSKGKNNMMEVLEEIEQHCQGCEYFEIAEYGSKELYICRLLEEQRINEFEDYFPAEDEGLLVIAEYDMDGNLINAEWVDSYPENCPGGEYE